MRKNRRSAISNQQSAVSSRKATAHAAGHRVEIPRRIQRLLETIGRLAQRRGLNAYAVGGCVRDWILGVSRTPDTDITVEGDGIVLAQDAARTLKGALTIHQQFGTATVRTSALRIDFASCRRETYAQPAAYPRVSAGTLEDDLFRRDFTINAMAIAINPGRFGRLIDPYHGVQDLRCRVLRMLHARSFLDDPSRMLRGVRFVQRFELRWDAPTRRAAQEAIRAGAIGRLNAGRLRKELDRMLEEPHPRRCLQQLASLLDPELR